MGVALPILLIPGIALCFVANNLAKENRIKNSKKHSIIALLTAMFISIFLIVVFSNSSNSSIDNQLFNFTLFFSIVPPILTYGVVISKDPTDKANNKYQEKEVDIIDKEKANIIENKSFKTDILLILFLSIFCFPVIFLLPIVIIRNKRQKDK